METTASIYMVAILPPPELSIEIDTIRKQCAMKFGVFAALKPPVHITLKPPFKNERNNESKLISILSSVTNFHPFKQKLNNFKSFASSHTIYIAADNNNNIQSLHRNIKKVFSTTNKEIKGEFQPHITIAYRDTSIQYSEIVKEYGNKIFQAEFEISSFTLLRHNNTRWEIVKHFNFNKEQSEQLNLDF